MPLAGRGRRPQQAAHTVQWLGYLAALRPCTPPRDIPNHRSWEPRHGAKMAAHARALCRCSPPVAPRALACAAAARPPRRTAAQADMLAPGTIRQCPLLLCKCWRAESGVVQAGREGETGAVLRGGGHEGGGVSSVFFRPAPGGARSNYWHPMKRSQPKARARATYGKNGATSAAGGQAAQTTRSLDFSARLGPSK